MKSVRISRSQHGTRITGLVVLTRDGSTVRIELLARPGQVARTVRIGRLTRRNRSAGTFRFNVRVTRTALEKPDQRGKLRLTVRVTVISGSDRSTARRRVTLRPPATRADRDASAP
jgi:hypothetical protein